jgi:outer membrane protein assembly factor BamB
MFTKSASKKKFTRSFLSVGLLTVICISGLMVPRIQAQEKPNLSEPFKKCWVYGGNNGMSKIVASDNELNIIATIDGYSLTSVNPNTTLENWKLQTGGRLEMDAISDEANLYFVTSFENETKVKTFTLNSISLKTGITNWQKKITDYTSVKLNQIKNKNLLFLTIEDSSLMAISKSNGEIRWTKGLSTQIVGAAASESDELNILLEDRLIRALVKSGEISEETKLKKSAITNSIVKDTYLLLGYSTGEITKVTANNNKNNTLWKIKAGASISGLAEYQNEILVTSLDNFIYLFSRESGKLRWKKRVAGRINIKPLIYESFAVVVNSGDNSTSVVDLSDGKVINQIPLEGDTYFSGQPYISGIYVVLQTSRGIYFYVNAKADCK